MPETGDDRDWRLTPRELLFEPVAEDGASDPSAIIANRIMRRLANGEIIDEETSIQLADILARRITGNDENPLDGFERLICALDADYAYYDANHHLEGFSEGMVYGMSKLAATVVETLDERSDRFLPASALKYPDVLVTSSIRRIMDVSKISVILGIDEQSVRVAIGNLILERLVVISIMGYDKFMFPSRMGEGCVDRIKGMVMEALSSFESEEEATDMVMDMSDFSDREAVARCVRVVRHHMAE